MPDFDTAILLKSAIAFFHLIGYNKMVFVRVRFRSLSASAEVPAYRRRRHLPRSSAKRKKSPENGVYQCQNFPKSSHRIS